MNDNDIKIDKEDLGDLLAKRTNNPIADEEIPRMLREILAKGGVVTVTDKAGGVAFPLELDEDGKFRMW